MDRDSGRGEVCVGNREDNDRVFIIVFRFDLILQPRLPPSPLKTCTHFQTHPHTQLLLALLHERN